MVAEDILSTLGLALRAGRLEVGEEPVAGACRGRYAKVILTARDAAPNTVRRVEHFSQSWRVPLLCLPFSKEELGRALGRSSCAVAALTDAGFARSLAARLSRFDPERYAPDLPLPEGPVPPPPPKPPRRPVGPPKPKLPPGPKPPAQGPGHRSPAESRPPAATHTASRPGTGPKPGTSPGPRPSRSGPKRGGGFGPGGPGRR